MATNRSVVLAGAAIALVGSPSLAQTTPHFRAAAIQTLGDVHPLGYAAINNSGLILLTVWIEGDDAYRAQLWDSRGGTPYLPARAPGSLGETLYDLNEAGDATGDSFYAPQSAAVVCHNGVVTTLTNPPYGDAHRINETGVIAGSNNEVLPTLWNADGSGSVTQLPVPMGRQGVAFDVNNLGVAVGWVQTSSSTIAPAMWSGGQMTLLPTLGSGDARALRINDAGQILCRWDNASGEQRAYLWNAGVAEVIPGARFVFDMNQSGQCVGDTADGQAMLFVGGNGFDLLGLVINRAEVGGIFRLLRATAINDLGQIIVIGQDYPSLNLVPLLLTPTRCGSADFNGDGSPGTDADIEAFFACIAGNCCPNCGSADFNSDGDFGTDADIEAFFRVLAGGSC
jgi:uncharacterized membrane protein